MTRYVFHPNPRGTHREIATDTVGILITVPDGKKVYTQRPILTSAEGYRELTPEELAEIRNNQP